jgi:hypothetical protein
MSELTEITADTVAERAAWTSDPVKILTGTYAGRAITAEIDGSPDALLVLSELGEDYRNCCILHVTSDLEASYLSQGDKVQFKLFNDFSQWKVLKRRNSGAQIQTDFWVMQITTKDQ